MLVKLATAPRTARRFARRDPLTGLGNRRALAADRARGAGSLLTLCLLEGLEEYARDRGRSARDRLLERAGRALAAALGDAGRAYRTEGGEFWLLAPVAETEAALAALAAHAPVARGSALVEAQVGGQAALAAAERALAHGSRRAGLVG